MGDKHSLNCEVRELKLGTSFTNKNASQYHTIKYDFKPASVDVNKMATVDVGTNNQVTVTVPHLDGSGVPQTVFKGNQRPYTKECVLIIDRVTGEITLEKLSSNIQVKKTRQENIQKPRPLTPVTSDYTNCTQRSTSRTRVATNKRTGHNAVPAPLSNGAGPTGGAGGAGSAGAAGGPRFNAAGASKSQNMVRSPPRQRTSPPQAPWSVGGNSTLASLPMIGFDETPTPAPAPAPAPATAYVPPPPRHERPDRPERPERPEKSERADRPDRVERNDRYVPERQERPFNSLPSIQQPTVLPAGAMAAEAAEDSSSSSSSSESGSDSGSDSDSDDAPPPAALPHHATNGNVNNISLPSDVLNDDLCLSESGSDFD